MTHPVSPKRPRTSTVVVCRSTPFEHLPTWLSVYEVQAFLGLSRSSAYAAIRNLPKRKFGRHFRVSKYQFQPTRGRRGRT